MADWKKIGIGVLLVSSFYFLASGHLAFAQLTLAPECNPTLAPNAQQPYPEYPEKSGQNPPPCNITAFVKWIQKVIRFLLTIAIPLGVGFIAWGAFVIMTAGGSEEKVKKGKDIVLASVIGIAIAFAAWLIVVTVQKILRGGI